VIGGQFGVLQGERRKGLGAVDVTSGSISDWNPQPSGGSWTTNSVSVGPSGIAVGGRFQIMGGALRGGGAALDLTSGQVLPWAPAVSAAAGLHLVLRSMTSDGNRIFATTAFEPGGDQTTVLKAFDATSGAVDMNFVTASQTAFPVPIAAASGVLCTPCAMPGGASMCGLNLANGHLLWSTLSQ